MPDIDAVIAAGADDGRASSTGGTDDFSADGILASVGDLFEGYRDYLAWFVFTVAVPQGSIIDEAHLRVRAFVAGGEGPIPTTVIRAHDTDNASPPANNVAANAVPLTAASTGWTPPAWVDATWYDSPDLSDVISEVAARPGWVSGNRIGIYWKDANVGWGGQASYIRIHQHELGSPAELHLSYSAPPPAGDQNPKGFTIRDRGHTFTVRER